MKYDRIEYNPDTEMIRINERTEISWRQIRRVEVIPQGIVVRGNRDPEDRNAAVVLCLELFKPIRDGFRTRSELALCLPKVSDWMCEFEGEADKTLSPYPYDAVVVEAKIKMNDYTKAATTGTNAYGRLGSVAPVIEAEVDAKGQTIAVKYLGTTSRLMKSLYFSEHPEMTFDMAGADFKRCVLRMGGSKVKASVEYEYRSIEQDEQGSGLWYARIEHDANSLCSAAAWINGLTGDTREEFAKAAAKMKEPPASAADSEAAAPFKEFYIADELIHMLDVLHDAGVLSDEEWSAKKDFVHSGRNR